jgi:hypothetical protein
MPDEESKEPSHLIEQKRKKSTSKKSRTRPRTAAQRDNIDDMDERYNKIMEAITIAKVI